MLLEAKISWDDSTAWNSHSNISKVPFTIIRSRVSVDKVKYNTSSASLVYLQLVLRHKR